MADDIPDIYADGARLLVNPAGFTLSMTLSVPAEGEQQQPVAVVNVVRLRFSHELASRLGRLLVDAAQVEVPPGAITVEEIPPLVVTREAEAQPEAEAQTRETLTIESSFVWTAVRACAGMTP